MATQHKQTGKRDGRKAKADRTSASKKEANTQRHKAAEQHGNAAFHHATAAHHHRQAAQHTARGNREDARRHHEAAGEHRRAAEKSSDEALMHEGRLAELDVWIVTEDDSSELPTQRMRGSDDSVESGRDDTDDVGDESEDEGRGGRWQGGDWDDIGVAPPSRGESRPTENGNYDIEHPMRYHRHGSGRHS